jgi:hypothetical protein
METNEAQSDLTPDTNEVHRGPWSLVRGGVELRYVKTAILTLKKSY